MQSIQCISVHALDLCTGISLVLIYLNKMWVWHVPILDSDLHRCHWYWFDQNMGIACANVRLRCSWISPVLIYLIKMWVWYVPTLDSDVHGYHWYWFFWSKCGYDICQCWAEMFMDINSIDFFYQNVGMAWLQLDQDVLWYHWHWFIWSN